jgi:hypothetical protein
MMATKPLTEEELDHTPLTFGKFSGFTPDEVSKRGIAGESYIRWMYETVTNKNTCSFALYKACGGKGKSAVEQEQEKVQRKLEDANRKLEGQAPKSYSRRFDDMDDDIPF